MPLKSNRLASSLAILWVLIGAGPAYPQSLDELFSAAVELKRAHVIRSYNSCLDSGQNDQECRAAIEALHPREISALSRLSSFIAIVPEAAFMESFMACYDPNHDYEELIACWEDFAGRLDVSGNSEQAVNLPANGEAETIDLEELIVEALRCDDLPSPLPAFLALEELGLIDSTQMVGFDSISCFRIDGGLNINGLVFDSICGHEENADLREQYPEFLWRGPGTSPGQFISLGTASDFRRVAEWYIGTFQGTEFLNRSIVSERTTFGDKTEVICSSWIRY